MARNFKRTDENKQVGSRIYVTSEIIIDNIV